MAIILFDGVDKSGKSTIIKKLHEKTKYRHVIVDRFIASNYCYGKFKHRRIKYKELLYYDEYLSVLPFVRQVILFADIEDIKKRFKKHRETDLELDEIQSMLDIYKKYLKKTKIPTLVINTSLYTVDECVDKILVWLRTWLKR